MIRSFRLRMALLSALLSGLVLAAFGLGSLWLIRGIKTEKIDLEIRAHAERQLARSQEDLDWQAAEGQLTGNMGIRNPSDLALLVLTGDGESSYQSPHWPSGITPDTLDWPKPGERPRRPGFGMDIIPSAQAADLPWGAPVLLAQGGGGGGGGGRAGGGRPGGGGPPGGPGGLGGLPLGPQDGGPPPGIPVREPVTPLPRPPSLPDALHAPQPPADVQPSPVSRATEPPAVPLPQAVAPTLPTTPATPPAASPVIEHAPPALPPVVPTLPYSALPTVRPGPPPASSTATVTVDGQKWRIGMAAMERGRVAIAVNERTMDSDLRGIRNAFLLALPFALVLIGMGSWLFSGRALQPVHKLTKATQRVTAAGLSQRIAVQGEDREFAGLIEVFNRMLERLERSFKQAHRFSADAAHELKTPLAIVQGQLERAIAQSSDGSPMQATLTSVLDEVRRLSTISRKLLLLSQADAGRLSIHNEPFNLSAALDDLLEDTRMLAPHLKIGGDIQSGLVLQGDASLLRQLLHNLISNAIKYNEAQDGQPGWIRISTALWSKRVEVLVSNASNGIAPSEREKIFERFYRVDSAHSRATEGVGLGLSLSREIARAHGGDLTLKTDVKDEVQFSLLLPLGASPLPKP